MSIELGVMFRASVPATLATTMRMVAHGRASARMPGISPGRSGVSRGVGMRERFAGLSGRSSFGARLRSRVPQYGHSVTYGLTSEPHFLQMTNRSAPGIGPIVRARDGPSGEEGQDAPADLMRMQDETPMAGARQLVVARARDHRRHLADQRRRHDQVALEPEDVGGRGDGAQDGRIGLVG